MTFLSAPIPYPFVGRFFADPEQLSFYQSINRLIDINSYSIDSFTPEDDKLCGGIDGNQCPRALSE